MKITFNADDFGFEPDYDGVIGFIECFILKNFK